MFNMPENYLQNHPDIIATNVAYAQEAIDRSATPDRYQVVLSEDKAGNTIVVIEDANKDAIFNESQTGTMAQMRSY